MYKEALPFSSLGSRILKIFSRSGRLSRSSANASKIRAALRESPELASQFRASRADAAMKSRRLAELEHEFASAGPRMDQGRFSELKGLRKELKGGETAYLNRSRQDMVEKAIEAGERRARGLSGADRAVAERNLSTLRDVQQAFGNRSLASASMLKRYGTKALAMADPVFIAGDVGEGIDNIREGNYGSAAVNFGRAALFTPFLRHFPGGVFNGVVRPFERARTMGGPIGWAARNSGKLIAADMAASIASPYIIPEKVDPNNFEKITNDAKSAQGHGDWNSMTPQQRGDLMRQALNEYLSENGG